MDCPIHVFKKKQKTFFFQQKFYRKCKLCVNCPVFYEHTICFQQKSQTKGKFTV